MENFIIICLLIIAVGLAIIPTIRHFKGHGGCCGGSSYKPKKKKLKRVIQKKTFKVEGMHCEHCSNRVMEAVIPTRAFCKSEVETGTCNYFLCRAG